MTSELRIVTANIKAWPYMRQWRVRQDVQAIRDRIRPDMLATQEMWLARYRRALTYQLRRGFGHSAPRSKAGTCVSWSSHRLRRLETGATLLHRAVPGRSLWRRIVWAGLAAWHGPERIAFASVHFTPGRGSSRRAARAWHTGGENLHAWIEDRLAEGYTHVVVAGDFNAGHGTVREALGNEIRGKRVQIRTNPGRPGRRKHIDHIVLIGAWFVRDYATIAARHSDHDPFLVTAQPLEPVKGRL